MGDNAAAVRCYQRALDLYREPEDRYQEAMTLTHLADAHASGGDLAVARNACISAIAILEGLGHPDADRLPAKLGPSAQTRAGEPIHTRDQHLHTENVLSSIADPAHKGRSARC